MGMRENQRTGDQATADSAQQFFLAAAVCQILPEEEVVDPSRDAVRLVRYLPTLRQARASMTTASRKSPLTCKYSSHKTIQETRAFWQEKKERERGIFGISIKRGRWSVAPQLKYDADSDDPSHDRVLYLLPPDSLPTPPSKRRPSFNTLFSETTPSEIKRNTNARDSTNRQSVKRGNPA